ncbi:MAG: hypothetical protein LKF82_07125 [Acinetobacter populi]|jgi:hypothetical protein|uniref:hypothetical protein n=1 Tax=Acinetobacter populi TaxID=1582270 RepID=UPI0023528A8F|nr:hypothetical protein [Acinetobacter populi]MCH4247597.1 hypothetical protein [Acinetobacter populi]
MAKYTYTYGGSQAAFVFSGVVILSQGVATTVDEDVHQKLSENKFAKHLIDKGELVIEEIAEDAAIKASSKIGSGRGKGGKTGTVAANAEKAANEAEQAALTAVKASLQELQITFTDDESLEQLQAKLEQAKE